MVTSHRSPKLFHLCAVFPPKDIVFGALAFYGDVKAGATNIKDARGAACQAVLTAEELEPSWWKSGFVKRCEKGAIKDPADAI